MAPGALASIAGFAALLRDHGLNVGVAEQQAMVRAALTVPLERAARPGAGLDAAWRAIACHDARDWRRWPELFERYWHAERLKGSVKVSGQTRPSRDLRQVVQALHDELGASAPPRGDGAAMADTALDAAAFTDDAPGLSRAQGGASRTEALHDRSLTQWLPQDLATLQRLAERIAQRLRRQVTRRWRDDARGYRLDVRRTLRSSLATGGVPLAPAWRTPRRERPRLFVLVDVSRSMETHAQLFLRIARAFVHAADARVFVFHTRLAEVTPLLRRDSGAVQDKVNAVTAGFGGGTRIATSLNDFARVHARGQLGRRARVWILSDGFDADPPQQLRDELLRLRAGGAKIAWFHPSAQPPASQAVEHARDLIGRFARLATLRDLEQAAVVLQ
ncbi:vWA domain-containing protein [Azohydromonas sediminis]|uniref:vWA domain-containing protein n=1 Tax=Azohydromonas sediminis TaxID=2259674 RepID=UPI000E6462CB|nr:VWA domain-containing protein [Azohydromonas sediminis]